MIRTPVHAGLRPAPLRYRAVADEVTRALAIAYAARDCEAAHDVAGFYRCRLPSGARWFARRLPAERIGEQLAAAQLAGRLAASCPEVPAPAAPLLRLTAGAAVQLWPWIDGSFARGTAAEMEALGRLLARLHRALRQEHASAPWMDASRLWDDDTARLGRLSEGPVEPPVAAALQFWRDQRGEVQRVLRETEQPLHNDLHPGNVFFDAAGGVRAVFDWEEALRSAGSPWIDASWVVERFCLTQDERAEPLAQAFIAAWRGAGGPPPRSGVLAWAIRLRCLRALALLGPARPEGAAVQAERDKFVRQLASLPRWEPLLERLERSAN